MAVLSPEKIAVAPGLDCLYYITTRRADGTENLKIAPPMTGKEDFVADAEPFCDFCRLHFVRQWLCRKKARRDQAGLGEKTESEPAALHGVRATL
jgi:hypothetical protein